METPPAVGLIIAHPDDEIFASNLLYALARTEYRLFVLCVTNGGGGQLVGDPPLVEKEALGAYREKEMRRSVSVYDVDELLFLRVEDQGMEGESENRSFLRNRIKKGLSKVRKRHGIQCLITHGSGGEYGHYMHRAIHESVLHIARVDDLSVITFWANNGQNINNDHTNVFDIASFDLKCDGFPYHKFRSLLSHRTQWVHFTGKQSKPKKYKKELRRYAKRNDCESYRISVRSNQANSIIREIKRIGYISVKKIDMNDKFLIRLRMQVWRLKNLVQKIRYQIEVKKRVKEWFKL